MKKINLAFFLLIVGTVVSGAQNVSPVHNRVFDYVPAPGQFINALPEWEEGDDAAAMAQKAYDAMSNEEMISLGAYGGYVTVGFEKTIVNAEGKRDIFIEGNAFYANATTRVGGSAEPGVVLVAYDINKNGRPDDNEWFEIAGSEYNNSIHGYEITYTRPASDTDDIAWKDNQGNTGKVCYLPYNKQPYWPQWLRDKAELTFRGMRLPDNGKDIGTPDAPFFKLESFDYGYADNHPNWNSDNTDYNEDAKIDIDWAVDRNGNAVKMPGVDFVRIYTGVNQSNGWIGENSTEVIRVMNAHIKRDGRNEYVDESVKIDEKVLADFMAKYGEGGSVEDIANDNLRLYFDCRSGMLSFTLTAPAFVQIYDMSGRQVYAGQAGVGAHEMDMNAYPSGLYIVKVHDKTLKLMKK